MAIHVVRLGSPRGPKEGPRLGTVRRPPRGVKKADWATSDHFDLWLPDLAPSADLLAWMRSAPITPARWKTFSQRYAREMKSPAVQRLVALLALLSRSSDLAVGCYCENEAVCHRSLLREMLIDAGAVVASNASR
jgi:uncharacterized protein YeaO (DUF488 family)